MAGSPTARRRRLAAELRRLREQAGMTGKDVVQRLGWTESKLSRIETRRIGISTPDLRRLLDVYDVPDQAYREQLIDMARYATMRGWWQSYGDVIPSEYANLIGLEEEAVTVRWYEQEIVPGLLQTPDYARAVIRASRSADDEAQIDRRVAVRMERQQILRRSSPTPPELKVIVNEAVLRRRVGDSSVMRDQIRSLSTERDRANVTVQVLPFSAGEHPAMVGPFTLLDFADPDDLGVVSIEQLTSSLALEHPRELQAYRAAWEAIQARALSPHDSRALMRTYELR